MFCFVVYVFRESWCSSLPSRPASHPHDNDSSNLKGHRMNLCNVKKRVLCCLAVFVHLETETSLKRTPYPMEGRTWKC